MNVPSPHDHGAPVYNNKSDGQELFQPNPYWGSRSNLVNNKWGWADFVRTSFYDYEIPEYFLEEDVMMDPATTTGRQAECSALHRISRIEFFIAVSIPETDTC